MNYWILKTEPSAYSWQKLVEDGSTLWDGVRNYQARNNMKSMQKGDLAFIYHSVSEKKIHGIATITRTAYPDPTTDDERWVAVDIEPTEELKRTISLEEIKQQAELTDIALIKQSRLSIIPLTKDEFMGEVRMMVEFYGKLKQTRDKIFL